MSGGSFTVFGAGGFIGRRLSSRLAEIGHDVATPNRDVFEPNSDWIDRTPLGAVIYCIGRTADFRQRPIDTVEAHTAPLAAILRRGRFESLLFLSSTRVYAGLQGPVDETASVTVNVADPDQLYNASKISGEALCLAMPQSSIRVARLSNVYGNGMPREAFLASLLREAAAGSITVRTAPSSAKDYVRLDDACDALSLIASEGRSRLYNVASGVSTDNATLVSMISQATGCRTAFEPNAPVVMHPDISISRLNSEFGDQLPHLSSPISDHMSDLIREFAGADPSAVNLAKETT